MLKLPDNASARIAFEEATNKPVKSFRGGQPLHSVVKNNSKRPQTSEH